MAGLAQWETRPYLAQKNIALTIRVFAIVYEQQKKSFLSSEIE